MCTLDYDLNIVPNTVLLRRAIINVSSMAHHPKGHVWVRQIRIKAAQRPKVTHSVYITHNYNLILIFSRGL